MGKSKNDVVVALEAKIKELDADLVDAIEQRHKAQTRYQELERQHAELQAALRETQRALLAHFERLGNKL